MLQIGITSQNVNDRKDLVKVSNGATGATSLSLPSCAPPRPPKQDCPRTHKSDGEHLLIWSPLLLAARSVCALAVPGRRPPEGPARAQTRLHLRSRGRAPRPPPCGACSTASSGSSWHAPTGKGREGAPQGGVEQQEAYGETGPFESPTT